MHDVKSWTLRVQANLDQLQLQFEDRFGYPPDDNIIVPATGPSLASIEPVRAAAPAALLDFFAAVDEVSLPDVWNGYFLGPTDRVVSAMSDPAIPHQVDWNGARREVLTVGSDGGGALYCVLRAEPGTVLRLREVPVSKGLAVASPGEVVELAPDFGTFLDGLAESVEAFVTGLGTPEL